MKQLLSNEKRKILDKLNLQFGIEKINGEIIQFGEEKYRIYSGNFDRRELFFLDKNLRIENCGLYFAKEESDGIRLTLDGVQLFKSQIKKNIIELNEQEALEWMKGNEVYIKSIKGFVVLKNMGEFIGCGKSTGDKITNFMPKERRLK